MRARIRRALPASPGHGRQLRESGARLSPENWTPPLGRVRFSRPHPPKTVDEVVRYGEGPLTTLCGTRRALEVVTKYGEAEPHRAAQSKRGLTPSPRRDPRDYGCRTGRTYRSPRAAERSTDMPLPLRQSCSPGLVPGGTSRRPKPPSRSCTLIVPPSRATDRGIGISQ